jgi:hypothetical protein
LGGDFPHLSRTVHKYENGGMEKSDESRTRRDEQRRKCSKMDKRAKDSWLGHVEREWRRIGCPKRS